MQNFSRVLIANRGEIAVRIARSVRGAGLQSVAMYSDPDAGAPHVKACDTAVRLAGSSAAETYLDIDKVLQCAASSGAGAIHPGYGFLSENAEFASRCEAAGLIFIGPSPEAIALMGSKRAAKDAVAAAGVPCIKGYDGADQSDAVLVSKAREIGLPIMVKASMGGGGRGMRLVTEESALAEAIVAARREAQSAFGNGELILEQAITTGRHIEMQIAADEHGHVIHLGERDCSLQRRHQKVIEEAPSAFVDEALRVQMGRAAVDAARACEYRGVGTVEFLVAEDRSFSFLEMNTRLQVEHPVTELVTGIDLVDLQLRIARGEPLGLEQNDIALTGHAIEARIYAEDPYKGFVPQTGAVKRWSAPSGPGIRTDSGVESGSVVGSFYDPMLAKIMAYGADRQQARQRLLRALEQTTLLGVGNNQQFLHMLLQNEVFAEGAATITYLDQNPQLYSEEDLPLRTIAVAAVASSLGQYNHSREFLNWSNAEPMLKRRQLRLNGVEVAVELLAKSSVYLVTQGDRSQEIELLDFDDTCLKLAIDGVSMQLPWATDGDRVFIQYEQRHLLCEDLSYQPAIGPDTAASGEIQALTEGLLVALEVAPGDRVVEGQTLAVVEAMKMQHQHLADGEGTVVSVDATVDAQVRKGQLLVTLKLDELSTSSSEKENS